MRGSILILLFSVVLVTGCVEDPIIEKHEPTPEYRGEYCEYRDLGETFIKDCLSIEMILTDQMAFYTMYPEGSFDTVICEASVRFVFEESICFDSASTIFSGDYLTEIYFTGDYDIRVYGDSLSFGRFDYQTGTGCYVNMERLD